jgi:hypothetical protein
MARGLQIRDTADCKSAQPQKQRQAAPGEKTAFIYKLGLFHAGW